MGTTSQGLDFGLTQSTIVQTGGNGIDTWQNPERILSDGASSFARQDVTESIPSLYTDSVHAYNMPFEVPATATNFQVEYEFKARGNWPLRVLPFRVVSNSSFTLFAPVVNQVLSVKEATYSGSFSVIATDAEMITAINTDKELGIGFEGGSGSVTAGAYVEVKAAKIKITYDLPDPVAGAIF